MFRGSDFPNWRTNEPPRENRSPSASLVDQPFGRIIRSSFRPDEADQLCDGPKLPSCPDDRRKVSILKPVVEVAKKEINFIPEIDFIPQGEVSLPPLDLKCQKRRNSDEDSVTKPSQPKRWDRTMVDVMPGFKAPLIGVKESLEAYRSDRCVHSNCFECDTFLYCISAADLVLCPNCKAISPTDKHIPILIENSVILGIGLTVEHVLADPESPVGHF